LTVNWETASAALVARVMWVMRAALATGARVGLGVNSETASVVMGGTSVTRVV